MRVLRRVRRILGRAKRIVIPPPPVEPSHPLDAADVARLIAAGALEDTLRGLEVRPLGGDRLREWGSRGNRILVSPGVQIGERLLDTIVAADTEDALVVLAADLSDAAYLFVRGEGPTVFVGPDSRLPHAELHCGGGSSIVLDGAATGTWHPTLDARNGGRIVAGRDQLWATDVIISTDDMHRIADAATGERINTFGGVIRLGEHVWLGRDVMVLGGAVIGDDVVVGARTLVTAKTYPGGSILAGTPARVLRENVTWGRDDLA